MSEVHEAANVGLLMADYAVADQMGKLQMIGGGLQLLARDPATGMTAPFAVIVTLRFPAAVFNEQYAFELVLQDMAGNAVLLGEGEAADVLRIGNSQQVDEPSFPGARVPRRALPASSQVVVHFNAGLPLPPGEVMVWRVSIDGESKPEWTLPFFVPGPAAGPVLG